MEKQTNVSEFHIALTGHRPNKLGGYNINTKPYQQLQSDLEQYIEFQLQKHLVVVGHSGLALGADTVWSKAILAMKSRYPDRVKFHAEIPMPEQASAWFKKSDIDFWHEQVKRADETSYYGRLSDYPESERRKMAVRFLNKRNEGMLDHANILLAVWDGTSGGTGNAVRYAKKTNLPIEHIDPKKYFA